MDNYNIGHCINEEFRDFCRSPVIGVEVRSCPTATCDSRNGIVLSLSRGDTGETVAFEISR